MSQECKPATPLPDECIDCVYNDEEFSVGDLVDVRDNGCTKWFVIIYVWEINRYNGF